jgi:tripartite motif-containing protein 71
MKTPTLIIYTFSIPVVLSGIVCQKPPPPPEYVTEWTVDGELNGPSGVAVAPNGAVYVVDHKKERIYVCSSDGHLIKAYRVPGPPWDVAVDARNNFYVTFHHEEYPYEGWVRGYNADKEQLFERPAGIPFGIALSNDGDSVYYVDIEPDSVVHITTSGSFLNAWNGSAGPAGEFGAPLDVAVAPDGDVFVVECGYNRVQRFTPGGSYLRHWGNPKVDFYLEGKGKFCAPCSIAVTPRGDYVFVAQSKGCACGRIQYFTPSGKFASEFGEWGVGPGQFRAPYNIAFKACEEGLADTRGHGYGLYVADYHNKRIQVFSDEACEIRQDPRP